MRTLWIVGFGMVACAPTPSRGGDRADFSVGDFVVTEVFADSSAPNGRTEPDVGKEWFEIFNASGEVADLHGVVIAHSRPDGSRARSYRIDNLEIAAGGYATLSSAPPDMLPSYAEHGYDGELGELYNADGGKLVVISGDVEIDTVVYDSVESGRSRQLSAGIAPDAVANDDLTNWCPAQRLEFSPGNFGTPSAANDCYPVKSGTCLDDSGSTRPVVKPAYGQLVITEVLANAAGTGNDASQEWFEIQNTGTTAFDLNDLTIAGTAARSAIAVSGCVSVAPEGFALLARSVDPAVNGGLPPVDAAFNVPLANQNGSVSVLDGTELLDRIEWSTSGQGDGIARQLKPPHISPIDNDSPDHYCLANSTQKYGTEPNLGTPKAMNVCL